MSITTELHELHFSKGQLKALSADELELLLRLGLAVNELMLFQRWLSAILASEPRTEAAKDIWVSQVVTALVALAGKVFESLEVFRRRYLSRPLGREYQGRLTEDVEPAVAYLRAMGGRRSLLADVRNLFSFHFHNDEELAPFLDHLPDETRLSFYAGLCDANVLHHFAVEPLVTSLIQTVGATSTREAFDAISDEIQPAIGAFHTFVRWFEELAFQKMGNVVRVVHAPQQDDVGIIDEQRFVTLLAPRTSNP